MTEEELKAIEECREYCLSEDVFYSDNLLVHMQDIVEKSVPKLIARIRVLKKENHRLRLEKKLDSALAELKADVLGMDWNMPVTEETVWISIKESVNDLMEE